MKRNGSGKLYERSLSTILNYLRGTKTETGLQVEATLTQKQYQVGLKVKPQEMKGLNFERRRICPQWNYLFKPRPPILFG